MGWGDEIMVSGQARVAQEADPQRRKVVVLDRNRVARTHAMWANNPRITTESNGNPLNISNGPGVRPYIKSKSFSKWEWRAGRCHVGEIYFSKDELAFAEQYSPEIIIEPNTKDRASPNKDWGHERWQLLANALIAQGLLVAQFGPPEMARLTVGMETIHTPTFRHACAVLARARAVVLPEGGLHHAAAALGVKAVVIFGAYISPDVTGYPQHSNLFVGQGLGCGMRQTCKCCQKAMAAITPEFVLSKLNEILQREQT